MSGSHARHYMGGMMAETLWQTGLDIAHAHNVPTRDGSHTYAPIMRPLDYVSACTCGWRSDIDLGECWHGDSQTVAGIAYTAWAEHF